MNISKTDGEILLRALENAIRYGHLNDRGYDIRKFFTLHCTLVSKLYRSKEMRDQNWLPQSILEGTDLGLFHTVCEVNLGKAPIVKKFEAELKRQK